MAIKIVIKMGKAKENINTDLSDHISLTTYKYPVLYHTDLFYIRSGGKHEGTVSSSRKTAAN